MNIRLFLVSLLFLLFVTPAVHAGFVVKKVSLTSGNLAMKSTETYTKSSVQIRKTSFLVRLNKYLRIIHPYQWHRQSEWVGIAAIGCGIIGLFVPGVNFLAILFGVLGMGRGCKVEGLAITGFILGILELALFLIIQTVFISLILL